MFLNWYSKQYRSFESSLSPWWQGLVILSVPPNKCHPRPQGVHKFHSQKKHFCFFSASSQRQIETKSFSIKSLLFLCLSLWPPSPTPPMVEEKKERVQQVIHFSIVSLCTTPGSSENPDALLNFPSCGRRQTQSRVDFFFSYKLG